MLRKRLILAAFILALLTGCAAPALSSAAPAGEATLSHPAPSPSPSPAPTPAPTPRPQGFSLVWIADTQNMTRDNCAPISAMADWIAAEHEAQSLRYAISTGDIVGNGLQDSYWKRVAPALEKIRASVPLMTCAGNHDVGKRRQYERYLHWRFDTVTDPDQLFQEGRGSYALVDTDVGGFLLVGMGITISGEGYDWLNQVFSSHPDRTGILAVHDYLAPKGRRTQEGNRLFERVVSSNPNVRFVLCGHNRGISRLDSPVDDDGDGRPDRTVYQMMYNFQNDTKKTGYLRTLAFAPDRSLQVTTYSPYMEDYNYYDQREDEETFRIENAF